LIFSPIGHGKHFPHSTAALVPGGTDAPQTIPDSYHRRPLRGGTPGSDPADFVSDLLRNRFRNFFLSSAFSLPSFRWRTGRRSQSRSWVSAHSSPRLKKPGGLAISSRYFGNAGPSFGLFAYLFPFIVVFPKCSAQTPTDLPGRKHSSFLFTALPFAKQKDLSSKIPGPPNSPYRCSRLCSQLSRGSSLGSLLSDC
jgi:hypothetical protein